MYKKIIILVSLVGLLSACTIQNILQNSNQKSPENIEKTGQTKKQTQQKSAGKNHEKITLLTIKIAPEIVESEPYKKCIAEKTQQCVNQVGTTLAQEKNDLTYCQFLTSTAQQESCEFGIIFSSALKSEKSEECEKIKNADYKKSCILTIENQNAVKSKDPKQCEKFGEIVKKYETKDDVDEKEALSRVENCKFEIIRQGEKFSIEQCTGLTDKFIKMECENLAKMKNKTF